MTIPAPSPPDDQARIRAAIAAFMRDRPHSTKTWIADAASRIGQIQQITHTAKYTHPRARGTNIKSTGNPAAGESLIGTHTLHGCGALDVVGNAAVLDVYKFLRIDIDGRTLLSRAIDADPALAAAFSSDSDEARAWMAAFASLAAPRGGLASDTLAKQLYWPLPDGEYHLLAPLFSSGLAHRIWATIQYDRFSDPAKAADKARRNFEDHPHGYYQYNDVVVQRLGGTKPHNISQLNSERRGANYLFSSVPPVWRTARLRPPLGVDTVFSRSFGSARPVYLAALALRRFLTKAQGNTVDIRDQSHELALYVRDALLQFAAALHDQAPGWSAHPDCRLNTAERYWLDPWRGLDDKEFATGRAAADWRDAIAQRFGNWLNARLNTAKTPMGHAEYLEWHAILYRELCMMPDELEHHE